MNRLLRRTGIVLGVTVLLVPVAPSVASAHVTAVPNEASSPYFRTALRVGHGCEGSPTTTVRVQIPEGAQNPRAEVIPGWEAEFVYAEDAGTEQDEADGDDAGSAGVVSEIVWQGGNLPDTHFQEFGLNFRIADDAPEVLWFPVIQECEEGEHRWIEIPPSVEEWGDVDEPAPYVINTLASGGEEDEPAAAEDSGDDGDAGDTADATATDSGGTSTLTVVSLIAALLGLASGLAALVLVLRSGRRTDTP